MTMTKRINLRILQNTWYSMRGQFDYFHSLTELAEKVRLQTTQTSTTDEIKKKKTRQTNKQK